jgi:hypothetical protein
VHNILIHGFHRFHGRTILLHTDLCDCYNLEFALHNFGVTNTSGSENFDSSEVCYPTSRETYAIHVHDYNLDFTHSENSITVLCSCEGIKQNSETAVVKLLHKPASL